MDLANGAHNNKNRAKMYETDFIYDKTLKQYLLTTKEGADAFRFAPTSKDQAQDSLLKEEYPIGRVITMNTELGPVNLTVQRWRKVYVPSVWSSHIYRIYFREYENSEFPRTMPVIDHARYDALNLTEQGIGFMSNGSMVEQYSYEHIKIEHMIEFVYLYRKKNPKQDGAVFRFAPEFSFAKNAVQLGADDYRYLSAVLQKYAVWAWE